jgi:TBC1 domain family protein 5
MRKYIPGNQIDELHQTLDGIEELCSLLKPKHQYLFSVSAPIEAAFEADDADDALLGAEMMERHSSPNNVKKLNANNNRNSTYEVPNHRMSKNTSQILDRHRAEVEMSLIRSTTIGSSDTSQFPIEDPAREREIDDDYE